MYNKTIIRFGRRFNSHLDLRIFFFLEGGGVGGGHLLSTHILFIIKTKVTRVKPLRAEETSSYDLGTQFK